MNYNDELLKYAGVKDGRKTLARHPTKTWPRRDPASIVGVCFHQSLAHNGSAEATAKYHVGPNHISDTGLPGLSYTMFVNRANNDIFLANDVEDKTYSQGDATKPGDENAMFLAICFGGNFSGPGYVGTQEPSPFQMTTAHGLWDLCKKLFNLKNNQLHGHYDFGKPDCPGNALQNFIQTVNKDKDWIDKADLSSAKARQDALQKLGYFSGNADGIWGNDSRYALVQFQKAVNLMPDGVWGKLTEAAVQAALAKV